MKLLTVIGARPQFIKAAPVSLALKQAGVDEYLLHTGQHFDANMSKVFFEEMEIPAPSYNLGIHSKSHSEMTGEMMVAIERTLLQLKPDMLMVYGDTNSTLAGALAAKKLLIPVAHVEAGLRSFNNKMPEEINRVATDSISNIMFCPTETAVLNLEKEGYDQRAKIHLVGDVMYDAILQFSNKARHPENVPTNNYALCTLHRQENTDEPKRLSQIIEAFNVIAQKQSIVFPVHPRTRKLLKDYILHPNIFCIDPVGYLEMLSLLKSCTIVITDSGGLQKEAFFSGKYCITLRDETEWIELVDNGYNSLVGSGMKSVLSSYQEKNDTKITAPPKFYGSGDASQKIAKLIQKYSL